MLVQLPRQYIADVNGVPRVGAKAFYYQSGTVTPITTYTTNAYAVAHANPVIADSNGLFPAVYVNQVLNTTYKIVVKDSADVTVYTDDNIPSQLMNQSEIGQTINPRTATETSASVTPTYYYYLAGNALRYGADPTGVADSTTALQAWINAAWYMFAYTDGQGLWGGGGGAIPVLQLPPGKFKLSGTLICPTGITIRGTGRPSHTTSHTRLVMNSTAVSPPNGAGDNRNKPIFKFQRGTIPNGGTVANSAVATTLEDLEFWYVAEGASTFDNPLGGTGITFGNYPDCGSIFIDVPTEDFRVIGCVFQHAPADVRIKNCYANGSTAGDGFTDSSRDVNIHFELCEFDTGASHIYATNSKARLFFKDCQLYGTYSLYDHCRGTLTYQGGLMHGLSVAQQYIRIINPTTGAPAVLDGGIDSLDIIGMRIERQSSAGVVSADKAVRVHIVSNAITGATGSTDFLLKSADGGMFASNSIDNSGYNAAAGTGAADFIAALKMDGCRNMGVTDNDIYATDTSGTYGGFGILTVDVARASQKNFVSGTNVTAPYNGAAFNGQGRSINLAALDRGGLDYNPNESSVPKIGVHAKKRVIVTYSASMTIDASTGNTFEITATNGTAFTVNAPTNPSAGQSIRIKIINTSGGALGAVTWNAIFKLATWTSPANGASRTIEFDYDGVNWVESFRTAADVPN